MGRDWAPYEHYLSEQRHIQMGYGDLFYFLENMKMVYNGKEEMCCSQEEMAIRRQFPQLGRLLMNHDFMVLYEKLSKIDGGLDLLHQRDDELATFLKAGRIVNPNTNEYILKVDDIEGIDKDSYLVKWFAGKLDENFYYSERNNELFVEAMVKEAKLLALEEALKRQGVEILEYDQNAKERWGDLVDVMSPQECADLFGKPVRCGEEIFMPQETGKVALDEQINVAADRVGCPKGATTERTTEQER